MDKFMDIARNFLLIAFLFYVLFFWGLSAHEKYLNQQFDEELQEYFKLSEQAVDDARVEAEMDGWDEGYDDGWDDGCLDGSRDTELRILKEQKLELPKNKKYELKLVDQGLVNV